MFIGGFLGLFFGVALFFHLNNFLPAQRLSCGATFIEQKSSDIDGSAGGIQLFFRLDSGRSVQFWKERFTKYVKPGDRVEIYYHQGVFLKNFIPDSYEPVAKGARFWSDSELSK